MGCTQGALRTRETIEKFKRVPPQPGQTSPLLVYFGTLLTRGKLNAFESVELSQLVISQNKKHLLDNWFKASLHEQHLCARSYGLSWCASQCSCFAMLAPEMSVPSFKVPVVLLCKVPVVLLLYSELRCALLQEDKLEPSEQLGDLLKQAGDADAALKCYRSSGATTKVIEGELESK